MTFQLFRYSEKAAEKAERYQPNDEPHLPFDTLEPGQSLGFTCGQINIASLRSYANAFNRCSPKKFCVVSHGENGIELARIL